MYNLNNLMRNVLITAQEVIFHAPTKHTLDPRMIENSIIVAEERFIRAEIGTAMYDDMANAKNVVVTLANKVMLQAAIGAAPILQVGDIVNAFELMSPSYQLLWKQHLWKLVAECTLVSAYPEGFAQFGSEGVFHVSPPAGLMVTSGLVSPLLPTVKWTMDKKIQDRVGPLINSLHSYICKNKTSSVYTLYGKTCITDCDGTTSAPEKEKWSGFALDVYEDVPRPSSWFIN